MGIDLHEAAAVQPRELLAACQFEGCPRAVFGRSSSGPPAVRWRGRYVVRPGHAVVRRHRLNGLGPRACYGSSFGGNKRSDWGCPVRVAIASLLVTWLILAMTAPTRAEARVALVIGGWNYLMPVNAKLRGESLVYLDAVDADQIAHRAVEAGGRATVVILDAARDNPAARRLVEAVRASGKATRIVPGLAALRPRTSVLFALAAAPNRLAETGGDGRHSRFTEALPRAMAEPDAKVGDVFDSVRAAVSQATGGRQVPWIDGQLPEAVTLAQGGGDAPSRPTYDASEVTMWLRIKDSQDPADFRAYLERYPDGMFSELAAIRLERARRPVSPPPQPKATVRVPEPSPQVDSLRRFDGRYVWQIKRTWLSDPMASGRCPRRHQLTVTVKDGRIVEKFDLPKDLKLSWDQEKLVARKGLLKLELFGGLDLNGRLKDVHADVFFLGLTFVKIYFEGDLIKGTWKNRMKECGGIYRLAEDE